MVPESEQLSLLRWLSALAPCRIKPSVMMSRRTLQHLQPVTWSRDLEIFSAFLKWVQYFYLPSFLGSEPSLSSSRSRLPCACVSYEILCKTSRRSSQQNPHNRKSVEGGEEGYQNTRLPGDPARLISESLKPTLGTAMDQPRARPVPEGAHAVHLLKKQAFQVLTCGSSRFRSCFQSTWLFPAKGTARRTLSGWFWNWRLGKRGFICTCSSFISKYKQAQLCATMTVSNRSSLL